MSERAQWVCELAGLIAAVVGIVVVAVALWSLLGAGLALLAVSVPLVVLGNLRGKGDR
ncbi:hypothetical protein ABMX48_29475 [Streptomyces cavourensis]|uniref:hypothetical protein n=1 Tax=Streptomyces TaxID=1883 RepID=UPI001A18E87F|nr:hypothetical protein [Streptomyces sp. HNA39]MBH0246114.1 hypothetical protein [Streptomyces cavourensis]UQA34815.1 hypothetical protein KRR37_14490 [Streptomyces sp. HNA39]